MLIRKNKTKKLFYETKDGYSFDSQIPEKLFNEITDTKNVPEAMKPKKDKAYCLVTYNIKARDKITTALMYTEDSFNDEKGMKGWNIVIKNEEVKKVEYFSLEDNKPIEIEIEDHLFLVATEIPLNFINKDLSEKKVMSNFKPSLNYLKTLL